MGELARGVRPACQARSTRLIVLPPAGTDTGSLGRALRPAIS